MRSLVAAALLASLAAAPAAIAAPAALAPQVEDGFCSTSAPADVDARIASAVGALGVSAPTTAPIAILDTGVSPMPELGVDRVVDPFDTLAGTDDGSDLTGHGSEVAGIAAGASGLFRGVSPTSPVMPIRIFNRLGESSIQALVAGIHWAADHGAAAVNISSTTPQADVPDADLTALTRAITDAYNRGTVVVTAAGNSGTKEAVIPAVLPHVLVVGASDLIQNRATFSNTGPWVDLVAPAASLVAPMPAAFCSSGFGVANGTSFAAPAVSGAAALLAQLRPDLTVQQRFDALRRSARDLPPSGRDDDTGFGMLNVPAAVAGKPTTESSPEVDDDPVFVRGRNASGHPPLLRKARKQVVRGDVSPAKDPSDVYPVRLRKGDRFVASAKVTGSDALVFLALWKPGVGDFDVTSEITKQQIVSSGGFSATPELKMRVKKGGTYFVSVDAPDAIDEDDPDAVVPSSEPYRLTVTRSKLPVKKKTRARTHRR